MTFYLNHGKRALDIALSLAGLVVLAPILTIVALAVRISLGSPVLFRQLRGGLHQRHFRILKFRTMTGARGQSGNLLPDRDRLTALGRFLRVTSLDELPELLNVLKGEMSLVGPRPLLTRYEPWYTPEEARRFEVRPGITGLAQIRGRNALDWNTRFRYDLEYVATCTLWLDLKILFLTIGKVLRREHIHFGPRLMVTSLDEIRREQHATTQSSQS